MECYTIDDWPLATVSICFCFSFLQTNFFFLFFLGPQTITFCYALLILQLYCSWHTINWLLCCYFVFFPLNQQQLSDDSIQWQLKAAVAMWCDVIWYYTAAVVVVALPPSMPSPPTLSIHMDFSFWWFLREKRDGVWHWDVLCCCQ